MRRRISPRGLALSAVLCATAIAATAAEPVPATTFGEIIDLDAAGLAHLQLTNPNHYARAQRILAAANYLCRPRAPDLYLAGVGAQDLSCSRMFLQTSNPPKWRIGFRLDASRYVASVILTDDPPRLIPAR
jgi:hypothetical protein